MVLLSLILLMLETTQTRKNIRNKILANIYVCQTLSTINQTLPQHNATKFAIFPKRVINHRNHEY